MRERKRGGEGDEKRKERQGWEKAPPPQINSAYDLGYG